MLTKIIICSFIVKILVMLPQPLMAQKVNLYRYYSELSENHFYTTNQDEVKNNREYVLERIECQVFSSQERDTVPLYRYYRTQEYKHFYTTNWDELKEGAMDYKYEGIACYVYPSSVAGTIPLHRYYNIGNGAHFYSTTPQSEILDGFSGEGIACYVIRYDGPPPPCDMCTWRVDICRPGNYVISHVDVRARSKEDALNHFLVSVELAQLRNTGVKDAYVCGASKIE